MAGGKTDTEIAEALKLKLIDVPASDTANKTQDGKVALDHPDAAKLINLGFDARSGVEREPVDLTDGGYGWVTTLATIPARQKEFGEVEAEVKSVYMTAERNRLLRELGQKIADRLSAGEAIDKVAAEFDAKPEKTEAITRSTLPQGLTEAAVRQAFALPPGKAGHTETSDRNGRLILKVAEIKAAGEPTKEQALQLATEIGQQIQIDTIDAYVAALQDAAGVVINEANLRNMFGAAGGS
jgi:peptidyl-prolyl cis-trans isomerase D